MSKCVVGIDLGGTYIKGALFDTSGKILAEGKLETEVALGQERVIQNIISLVNRLRERCSSETLVGIGLGVPGALDFKNGRIVQSPNFPGWENVPIRAWIQKALAVPVILENDANAAAMGEMWAGAARQLDHFLLITLGTGVGGGLVLNRKLWYGENGKGGEVGHMRITPDGPPCGCGQHGCLEVYASWSALIRMAKEEWNEVKKGHSEPFPSRFETVQGLAAGAEKGDPLARTVFSKLAFYLGIGITNVANLLDINHFIISGGVSNAFHLFKEPLRMEVASRVFGMDRETAYKTICIDKALCGENAGMLGAGYLALLASEPGQKTA